MHIRLSSLQLMLLMLAVSGMAIVAGGVQAFAQNPKKAARPPALKAPDWFDQIPADAENLVARGKGKSTDQQVAVDKAVAAARAALANTIDCRWQELLQAIRKEGGSPLEQAAEPVTLVGSTLKMHKTGRRGKTWTAFVLVALPEVSVHSVLLQRLHRDAEWYAGVRETKAVREFEAP